MEDFNGNMNYNYNQQNGGGYSDPNNQFYNIREGQKPLWAALTSFILSIVNVVFCCCCTYMTVPVSLVLGILSLAKKWRGKGFAISGVVISSVTIVVMLVSQILLGELSRDMTDIIVNSTKYAEEYNETGEIPEEFEKYNDDRYDWYWRLMGCEDFDDFYDMWMKNYSHVSSAGSSNSDEAEDAIGEEDFYENWGIYGDDEESDAEFGETPIEL